MSINKLIQIGIKSESQFSHFSLSPPPPPPSLSLSLSLSLSVSLSLSLALFPPFSSFFLLLFLPLQQCAPGYYRDTKGLFLGKCVPCNCNGHSDQCLDGSGVCENCQHNRAGDHCEKCQGGFLGNNSLDGRAQSCDTCPCPLQVASNKSIAFPFFPPHSSFIPFICSAFTYCTNCTF
uniref:Laminin EGF-like domain-containing protein n=1 Tax=Hucho hucho TaxID=62062 RepID=A0A4W5JWR5_9TELE